MTERNPFVPKPRPGGQRRAEARRKLREDLSRHYSQLRKQQAEDLADQVWTDEERRRTYKDPYTGVYVGPESKRYKHGKGI